MAGIDAKSVKQLRGETQARFMDCKKALEESGGDVEKARAWLRKKNLASGEKAAAKAAEEGALGYQLGAGGRAITVVELSANTDFAAKNEDFRKLLERLAVLADASGAADAESLARKELDGRPVSEVVQELAGKIGENIALKRVARIEGDFGYYVHHDNKQAAVVAVEGLGEKSAEVGKDLAMHVVFAKPKYLVREDVPEEQVAKEREILTERMKGDPKNAKKPPEILDKIATGQLNKFFGELCLLDQPYYRENKKKVAQVLKEAAPGAKIKSFVHFQVGAAGTG